MSATALLEIDGLRVTVPSRDGPLAAVDGVSLSVGRGEIVGLVGESGSGKTLTALSALGLLPRGVEVAAGQIRFEDRDITHISDRARQELRGARIGFVAQDPSAALNPVLNVSVQITETIRRHLHLGRAAATNRAVELLHSVGIPEPRARLHAYPHELSGGMRQRVAIAIAIACDPHLLIADEPTTALDVTVQAQIVRLLLAAASTRGASVLLISHDLRLVATVADRILVMYAGKLVEHGSTAEIVRTPEHPYTSALLDSTPRVRVRTANRIEPISGRLPDLSDMPTGCRFHPRCRFADRRCDTEEPVDQTRALCWYPNSTRTGHGARAPLEAHQ
jgi:oligopeptide/dipeptide ABC transporter ATP-binding protein